jgi:hypothetical protein
MDSYVDFRRPPRVHTRAQPVSDHFVTLPKMWRKVLVRAFAAIFYETDLEGGVSRLPQNMRLSVNCGGVSGVWALAADRMQCISPA